MFLDPKELDKLSHIWDFHRSDCKHEGFAKLEQRDGGGIGTATILICGCGREIDITDYLSW